MKVRSLETCGSSTNGIVKDEIYTVTREDHDSYWLEETSGGWYKTRFEIIKENNMSAKYYRVVKDHPAFEVGAILSNGKDSTMYMPVDDVFIREEIHKIDGDWYEGEDLVENQPEWFEQVFPIGKLEKMAFGTRKQAQAAAAALYKGSKK